MSQPDPDLDPINVAAVLGKLRWHVSQVRENPTRYKSQSLAELRGVVLELGKLVDGELYRREHP